MLTIQDICVYSSTLLLPCSVHHHGGRDEEDDDQPYNPQYESLPAARPMNPPEYKPTPEYPSSSVITSRTPVPYNGSSSMMEMQKVSNAELSKGQMYNYNSTSALTKQVCCLPHTMLPVCICVVCLHHYLFNIYLLHVYRT